MPGATREVLARGRSINVFMRTHRLGSSAESDWVRVRNDLNRLMNAVSPQLERLWLRLWSDYADELIRQEVAATAS